MNILFDHQIFTRQAYGGISRYFYELIRELGTMSEAHVDLFMGLHINRYDFGELNGPRMRKRGMLRPRIPFTGRIAAVANDVMLRVRRPVADIHHSTYFQPTMLRTRARVLTVYDMIYERFPEKFTRRDDTAKHKVAALKWADGIIAISDSTRKDVIELCGVEPEKVRTIHLANSMRWPVTEAAIVDEPYILYVGERHEYKNFHVLLDFYLKSAELLRDFKLVCFGGPDFSPAERERITQGKGTNRVVFLRGPDETLANLYHHACVLVYPSLYEGFGIPLLEAMFHGCPVLAGDGGSIPEIAGDAAAYFPAREPEALGPALMKLLGDETTRRRNVAAGREREKQFSWRRCGSETMALYKDLLGS